MGDPDELGATCRSMGRAILPRLSRPLLAASERSAVDRSAGVGRQHGVPQRVAGRVLRMTGRAAALGAVIGAPLALIIGGGIATQG